MDKTNIKYIGISGVILVLAAVFGWYYLGNPGTEETVVVDVPVSEVSEVVEVEESVAMPNPASVYCEETMGGELSMLDAVEGQVGLCTLPDGRVCEEWELYRTGNCISPEDLEDMRVGDKGGDLMQ